MKKDTKAGGKRAHVSEGREGGGSQISKWKENTRELRGRGKVRKREGREREREARERELRG